MNIANSYITGLVELGMSEREAKVYLALINKPNASLAYLQKMSGVRSNKMSEVLNSLIRQGLCSEKRVGQRRYFDAMDPGTALKPIMEKIEVRLEKGNKLRKELRKLFESSEQILEPFEYIEIIHGNHNIHRRYVDLLKNAEFELFGFTRPPFASKTKEMRDEQSEAYFNYIKRGGKSRGVREVHKDSLPRMFHNIHEGYKMEENFRIVPNLPLKMFVFDRKILLIAEKESLTEESDLTMTVVKQRAMIDGYIALFDFFWEQGLEYDAWIKGKEQLMEQKLAEFEKSLE